MPTMLLLNLSALAALVPALLQAGRPPDGRFWASVLVALAGPTALVAVRLDGSWNSSLGEALWATVAVTVLFFIAFAALDRAACRLAPLLMPYLLLLGVCATLVGYHPDRIAGRGVPVAWMITHIAVALATYALLTLAAVAALAVTLQERALKAKRPTGLTRRLPAVAEGEALQGRLMLAALPVLAIGVLTGMAATWFDTGQIFKPDHKTLFSLASLLVTAVLFGAHQLSGLAGRRAARLVLFAWLLLSFAYLGVKVVTELLLGRT